ncbi:potassium channel family protein [Halomonas organivorans]|uniref:Trk system potassium uptake protein TrkA n=1 Tax=Halomonas organivorans TaxID=257772 RepID=A0A7W5G3N7_9GAMM|nr:TrkA family potassium uptake protein [Halomonas organivorans]MBB3139503.1 trk system potassium uptake protein TrkA [Halomonas organivorans]
MSRQFAILGLGFFGITVAQELRRQNDEVLGVDRDASRVDAYADLFSHAVVGDITDEQVIGQLSLHEYDAVIIDADDHLEASMICTLLAREHGAREVWVKAHSDTHYRLLERLGADRIVYPEYDIGLRVAESLHYHALVDFIDLGDRQFVVELQATERLNEAFPSVEDMERHHDSLSLVAIKRDTELLRSPARDLVLRPRDRLVLVGELDALRDLGRHL